MCSPRKCKARLFRYGVGMLTFDCLSNPIGVYWNEEEVEARETAQNGNPIVFKLQSLWECDFILTFPLQLCFLHTPLIAPPQEMICLKLYEARDFNLQSKGMLVSKSKYEPLNSKIDTHLEIKIKFWHCRKGGSHLEAIATFSWHFTSNFLVAVLREVLPGILPNQSYAVCYNDCRSQSFTVGRCSGLALTWGTLVNPAWYKSFLFSS